MFIRAALEELVAQMRDTMVLTFLVAASIAGLYWAWLLWVFPILRVNIQSVYTQVRLIHGASIALALVIKWQTFVLSMFLGATVIGCHAYVKQSRLMRVFYGRLRNPAPFSMFVIAYTLLSLLATVEVALYPITWAPFLHTLSRAELASLVSAKLAVYGTALLFLALVVNIMGRIDKAEHAVVYAWFANGIYYLIMALLTYRIYFEATHVEKALVLKVIGRLLAVWIRTDVFPWRDPAVGAIVTAFTVGSYYALTNGVRRALE